MHEKEKYHMGPNDELLVDCKGGPINVVIKELTDDEKLIHKALRDKKNGSPDEAGMAPEPTPAPDTDTEGGVANAETTSATIGSPDPLPGVSEGSVSAEETAPEPGEDPAVYPAPAPESREDERRSARRRRSEGE